MRDPNYLDIVLWIFRRLFRFRIVGESMNPTLLHGDQVLVRKTKEFSVGDVVVARHPYKKELIIKRVAKIENDDILFVGDNTDSTDSRHFGNVKRTAIIGKVIANI